LKILNNKQKGTAFLAQKEKQVGQERLSCFAQKFTEKSLSYNLKNFFYFCNIKKKECDESENK